MYVPILPYPRYSCWQQLPGSQHLALGPRACDVWILCNYRLSVRLLVVNASIGMAKYIMLLTWCVS